MEYIDTVIGRIAGHAKVLRESGAPHQQEMATDLETLVEQCAGSGELANLKAQLANAQGSVDKAVEDRDQARKECDETLAALQRAEADGRAQMERL